MNLHLFINKIFIPPLTNIRGGIFCRIHHLPALLLLLLLLSGCSTSEPVVAEFGPHEITLEEFNTAYLEIIKQPDVFDSEKVRESFLEEMINRRLVAAEAVAKGIGGDERTMLRVKAFREKCLRDAHFQAVIKPQIHLEKNDILDVTVFLKQQRHLKHLFVKTKEECDILYQRLESGEKWDVLASDIFAGTELAKNGGDLDWVFWDQMEYEMGLTAFRQKLHTYSRPIHSNFGYHIIWVESYRINPIVSEYDVKRAKEQAGYLLETKAGEKIGFDHIGNLMDEKQVKVYPKSLKRVGEHLERILRRQPTQFDGMRNMQLQNEEVRQLENSIWDIRNEPIIKIDEQIITVGEFIYALNYIPYSKLYKNFKTAINYVIRDKLITDEAICMGLAEKDRSVNIRTAIYKEYILQLLLRQKITREVKVTDNEIRERYENLKNTRLKGSDYISLKPSLEQIMIKEKKINSMNEYFQMLRNKYEIKKDTKMIHEYYDKFS